MSRPKQNTDLCFLGSCRDGAGPWCKKCGFNMKEAERREKLPLVADKDGVYRKHV